MFETLLIANRGEIACRVMRTARRLGMRCIAVYTEPDADAMHVGEADAAYPLGDWTGYLDGQAVLAAARASGAQAIHPGYGFLAENADFAEACADAGITFVGPPARAIRSMGEKDAARALMIEVGVPVVPGDDGSDQADDALAAAAERVGYPVLLKPTLGGGGKGMRVVETATDFAAALIAARREATAAFGDDRILVERFLDRPRHIEVQVFGDAQGNLVHLFERECSLQRRHQKIVEEAPAPGLDAALRRGLADAALAAARAVDYVGAGTVEFLVDAGGAFYFLEMNTRLQVEHAVSEMITGFDLVEWQLRVAAGEPLPRRQDEIVQRGHAIEARLYAEDPARDFLPAPGLITHLRWPAENGRLRVDTGVRAGATVSIHYDPMIAKLVVWDEDRGAALGRLRAALGETQIAGPLTNVDFLASLAAHPDVVAGRIDTGWVERHAAALVGEAAPVPDRVLALASLDWLLRRKAAAARAPGDPHSPWDSATGWRLNHRARHDLHYLDGEAERVVSAAFLADGYRLGPIVATGEREGAGNLTAMLDGVRMTATVVEHGLDVTVFADGRCHRLRRHDPLDVAGADAVAGGRLTAPMPGRIAAVLVEPGAVVARGAPLIVLEAMKMEHSITAPADGRVERVNYAVGDLVEEGAELVAFAIEGED